LDCQSERISLFAFCLLVIVAATFACTKVKRSPAVDRHNPEAVLRSYFAAWNRNDYPCQKTLMTANYTEVATEPIKSVELISITPLDNASGTKREYAVSFDIKFDGKGYSMQSGRYQWTYTLSWDATRDSWLISNYGAG
jgi:hypothetical protein